MSSPGRIFIGTSGWSYRGWRGVFYPPKLPVRGYLSFYSREFATTEINCTFYRVPSRDAFHAWTRDVPREFCFAVKVNRLVTHVDGLLQPSASWHAFRAHAAALGPHLGPYLLQFPPTLRRNVGALHAFLDETLSSEPEMRLAVEFRHASWQVSEVYRLLARYRVAWCIADSLKRPRKDVVTTDFAYLRYHGRTPREAPNYTVAELREEAVMIRQWARDGIRVFAYFNNDAQGHAVSNARTLQSVLTVED